MGDTMTLESQYTVNDELEKKLLEIVSPESLNSLVKFLKIIRKLDELGVLDTLYNLLETEVIEDLANTFITTNSVYLLTNIDDAMDLMSKFVDAFKEASNAARKDERPTIKLLNELLTDEDAKRGLRFLSAFLKSLGRKVCFCQ